MYIPIRIEAMEKIISIIGIPESILVSEVTVKVRNVMLNIKQTNIVPKKKGSIHPKMPNQIAKAVNPQPKIPIHINKMPSGFLM